MNAKKKPDKKKTPKSVPLVARLTAPLRGRSRWVILAVGLLVAFIVTANILWRRYSPRILADSDYQISAAAVQITPLPDWIKSDVKAEVIGGSALSGLRIFDKQVVTRVADAFTVHPWVSQVVRVRKRPAGVDVELEYRRPVAFVAVPSGRVPVDENGILLPSSDFTASEADKYVRIGIADLNVNGSLGAVWRDHRVVEAAQIAAVWQADRHKVDLYRIAAPPAAARGSTTYILETSRGDQIVWGRPPGKEAAGEASAADKIAALVAFVQTDPEFSSAASPLHLDLRSGTVRRLPARQI